MHTIGILGANGFVGSRLVEKLLLEDAARIVPIVRNFAGLARLSRFPLEARIADVLDEAALVKAFKGCDIVVNTVLGRYNQIVAEPPVIYRAAEIAGVRRLVHMSTASVHGQDPAPGTDETTPLRTDQPVPYNNAKVRAERRFRELRRNGRVELVMLRPGIVFGPRDIWITGIARSLAAGEAFLVDGGRGICNTVYIDNLVHAIRLAMIKPVDGEVFLLGDNETITWAEIYHWVARAIGDCPPPRLLNDPPIRPEVRPMLDRLRGIRPLKALFRTIPAAVKAHVRGQIGVAQGMVAGARAARQARVRTDWTLPNDAIGPVPIETAMLHRCRYKFPFAKARARLGYEPVVSVEEGLIRSIRALRFAGFDIDETFAEELRQARGAAVARARDTAAMPAAVAATAAAAAPAVMPTPATPAS
ncbi:MAG TPA: NAD-dependent epimerase/dehydratase family protein [Alphaproteobacteria bacterium]